MQTIQKTREMLAQIGAACVQITRGCEEAQRHNEAEVVLSIHELAYALGELHACAKKLRENANEDTQPNNERPE